MRTEILMDAKTPFVKNILRAINYRKRKAYIVLAERMSYSGTFWDGGSRNEYTAVNLDNFISVNGPQFAPPQFGGPNEVQFDIPIGVAIIQHGIFCGKPATAFIHINPNGQSIPALLQ